MNCSFMPRAMKLARLAEMEALLHDSKLPAAGVAAPTPQDGDWGCPPWIRARRVDSLTSEFAQIKALLHILYLEGTSAA